jgi:hypothetical protein
VRDEATRPVLADPAAEQQTVAARPRPQHDRERLLRLLVERDAERAGADLQLPVMLDDDRAHLRSRAGLEGVLETEDGAEGVHDPVARGHREQRVLAGARVADRELSPDQRRVVGAPGQGSGDSLARHEDQVLRVRALPQHELAPRQLLVGRASGRRAQQEREGEADRTRGHVIDFPRRGRTKRRASELPRAAHALP